MTIACIDIGNTRTHLALVEDDRIEYNTTLNTHDWIHDQDRVLQQNDSSRMIEGYAFCSVVPAATEALRPTLEATGKRVFHLNCQTCPGLPIHYPIPEEIGQDRLANALGAQHRYGTPAIIIDMGTAVTFDIISSHGGYEGGIIAPGLEIMTRYLHEQTALLPSLDPGQLTVAEIIGKSTRSAMSTGCIIGFSGMIEALLEEVTRALAAIDPQKPKVVMTGGSAGSLPKKWLENIHYDPDLTLHGLYYGYRQSESAER